MRTENAPAVDVHGTALTKFGTEWQLAKGVNQRKSNASVAIDAVGNANCRTEQIDTST